MTIGGGESELKMRQGIHKQKKINCTDDFYKLISTIYVSQQG
jgi:hypothetical protein